MEKRVLDGYSPKEIFYWFEEITKIPRGSGKEEKIAAFIENFAREKGLYCYRDELNNVLVRMEATEGMEDQPSILLQGHTDMVCEKNSDVEFDFDNDPINIYVDNEGFLRAKGTTLGADDGVAVAIMLALLDGYNVPHPQLECLFTTSEEIGLEGATAFDYSNIKSRLMINLDSENDGEVVAGCAGGVRTDIDYDFPKIPFAGKAVTLSVTGLMGGHSGENINSGRANANKLMGRILTEIAREMKLNIIGICGGSKDNAIPRECHAAISVEDVEKLRELTEKIASEIKGELWEDDLGFAVSVVPCETPDTMADDEATRKIILFLAGVTNGVMSFSQYIRGLVEFSRNLGVVFTMDGVMRFTVSSRSANNSQVEWSKHDLEATAAAMGASVKHRGQYPGWDYTKDSVLRDDYIEIAREIYGKEPQVRIIHAGLECGLMRSAIPDLDIISIGPDMKDIHSPCEALDLASFARCFDIVCRLISKKRV